MIRPYRFNSSPIDVCIRRNLVRMLAIVGSIPIRIKFLWFEQKFLFKDILHKPFEDL